MAEPVLKPVWRMNDVVAERDVLAFWREEKLLSQDMDLASRLQELCVIAYADSRVVAVSTAVLTRLEQVRARVAMLRFAVAANYRGQHLATNVLEMARRQLQDWAAAHPEEKVMAIGTVVQARGLGSKLTEAVFSPSGLSVIGHTAKGEQLRLAWFPGATVDDPFA